MSDVTESSLAKIAAIRAARRTQGEILPLSVQGLVTGDELPSHVVSDGDNAEHQGKVTSQNVWKC